MLKMKQKPIDHGTTKSAVFHPIGIEIIDDSMKEAKAHKMTRAGTNH